MQHDVERKSGRERLEGNERVTASDKRSQTTSKPPRARPPKVMYPPLPHAITGHRTDETHLSRPESQSIVSATPPAAVSLAQAQTTPVYIGALAQCGACSASHKQLRMGNIAWELGLEVPLQGHRRMARAGRRRWTCAFFGVHLCRQPRRPAWARCDQPQGRLGAG